MDGGNSILETIGHEIVGVMAPVSICMLLVVLLVYTLYNPAASSATAIRTAANLVYLESPTDSTTQKLEGALLNAVVFVVLIALVTFVLVILYYYNFTNFLVHYTRFSAFTVFSTMGGSILLSLIQHFNIPIDAITFSFLLFNLTILGTLSIFSPGVPILVRQSYMVTLGIIVAAWFTKLPEWTTWVLLVALALYDLVAVLAPGGPLKLLVELASSRDEELPALIYEARPNVGNSGVRGPSSAFLVAGVSENGSTSREVELQAVPRDDYNSSENRERAHSVINLVESEITCENEIEVENEGENERETSPLMRENRSMPIQRNVTRFGNGVNNSNTRPAASGNEREEMEGFGTRGIKLGLGDFIFYSVLVGRAAMYDLMTVYACYLAIISGLGCTLILLAVCRHALPALPISIALGVMFYFLTRLLMEPFVVGTSTNLIVF